MKSFTMPQGLKATLFAAEPMIQNPTNMDIDPRGRVWCVECVNYRSTLNSWGILRPEGERVVILEDSKGDGVADKETTFFQSPELTNPLGICVLPQAKGLKVIVSAAPYVWLLTDDEGHDKATKAQKLFKVGGNFDDDHSVHAFVFGPDGKFYFNMGDECHKLMWPDGTVVKDLLGNEVTSEGRPYRHGMTLRCDIDLARGVASQVEVLAHNVRNSFETCVDSFGRLWQSDNDEDGSKAVRVCHLLDYGNCGYGDELTGEGWKTRRTNMEARIPQQHWHQNDPGVVPNLLLTGAGSPTGILVNEGGSLSALFENQLVLCDAGPRTVRAVSVTKKGAGYEAKLAEVLGSDDSWFRPSDCCVAPDGSLFVADWYDPVIGGHNMGDNEKGHMRGRIYRVAPAGNGYRVHAPDLGTAQGCAIALGSPSNSTRHAAWSVLHAMGSNAENALRGPWNGNESKLRARALHLLVRLPGKFRYYMERALDDADPDIRGAAVRELRLAAVEGALPVEMQDLAAYVLSRVQHEEDRQVLREYALCLRVHRDPAGASLDSFATAWAALAMKHDGNDRWYLEALGIGSTGREDRAFRAWLAEAGGHWNTPAGRDIVWRVRSLLALDPLTQLLTDEKAEENTLPRYLREFDFLPDGAVKDQALLKIALASSRRMLIAVDVFKRLSKTPLRDDAKVQKALQSVVEGTKGQPAFLELIQVYDLADRFQEALDLVLKEPEIEGAQDCVHFLLTQSRGEKLVAEALAGRDAESVIHLLGGSVGPQAVKLLTGVATDKKRDLVIREAAVKEMSLTAPGALALVELGEQGMLPEDLKFSARAAMAMVQYPGVNERAVKAFGSPPSAGETASLPIAQLASLKGDAETGREIFGRASSSCTLCHRVGRLGVDFAPALDDIGSKLGKEAIYDAILNPNAGVASGFETTQLVLKNGQSILGIVHSETNGQVILAFPGGATGSFQKSDIAERKVLPTSMMPSGLQAQFSRQALADLVEYLSTLRGKASKTARAE